MNRHIIFSSVSVLALVAAGLCVTGGSIALGAAQGQEPVFRGIGSAVRVFATVTDKDGRLVPALPRDVFEVRDEGKPQPITLFDNTPQPIRLVVMLDVSGSMSGNLSLMRSASEQLFSRLRPDDVARIGTFGKEVSISSTFTRDVRDLREALPRTIDEEAPTPLWRALDEAMDGFGEKTDTRRVVLVLSDGHDAPGLTGFGKKSHSQAQVIDRARDEEVMIYAIGMRSRGNQPRMLGTGVDAMRAAMMEDMPDPGLATVAEQSGGGYLEIRYGQDLGGAFARVADELHAQYLIGFAPPKRDGKVHDIEVRVSERGMKPRTRKSYVAPKDQK